MATYRTAQVTSANGVGQVVLLYQGALRFARQHLAFLEQGKLEQAHLASIRSQEIVVALRAGLEMSAGDIAVQLDSLYDFVLGRLVEGNVKKAPRPTEEAIEVLRGLLEAWQEIAGAPGQQSGSAGQSPALLSSAYLPGRPGASLVGGATR